MKRYFLVFALSAAIFTGCKDEPQVEVGEVEYEQILNKNLNAALKKLGYEYNEDGKLVVDDKVRKTTSLDLSSCALTSVSGLSYFEALESVDLADNNFGDTFDFKYFPSTVKSVDLRENDELALYSNLVGKRELSSLTLPTQAKWNMAELIDYMTSEAGSATELFIANSNGQVEEFSTLRTIPDAGLCAELKAAFPSIFSGDKLDVTKDIEPNDLILSNEYDNLEGVEYILSNPSYKGSRVVLRGSEASPYNMEFFALLAPIKNLTMSNINTPNGANFVNAKALTALTVINNPSLDVLTLNDGFLGSSIAETNIFNNALTVLDCENLTNVVFPKGSAIGKIYMSNLPALKSLDLSGLRMVHTIALSELAATSVVMPASVGVFSDGWGSVDNQGKIAFGFDASMSSNSSISAFVNSLTGVATIIDMAEYYSM